MKQSKIISRVFFLLLSILLSACESEAPAPVIEGWKHGSGQQSDYIVQEDDTVYSIAWAYGLDYHQIVQANHLRSPYKIYPGQHLKMAVEKASTPYTAPYNTPVLDEKPIADDKPVVAKKSPSLKTKTNQVAAAKSSPPSKQPQKSRTLILAKRNPTTNLNWCWPTKGRVTRKFTETSSGNHGLDISGRTGQTIVAAANGKVVYAGSGLRGYGKLIIIKHDESYLSAYAYNKSLLVKEGTLVKKGQKIAEMGQNDSNQTMLHFEIRQNGKPVNPLFYLRET